MKVIGLTGGIGAGKSTVSKIFETLGIPVYDSDTRAKQLYSESSELKAQMIHHFGPAIYVGEQINREKLAQIIFNDKEQLKLINRLVAPILTQDFIAWKIRKNTPYVIREAAILIESNSYRDCNAVIVVTASKEMRLERVVGRDNSTAELVEQRMNNQLSDKERLEYADFVINNDENESVIEQVLSVHQTLMKS